MAEYQCPQEWSEWVEWLAAGLHGQCRWRLPVLLVGMLFATGRRTVAAWLRAAGVGNDWKPHFFLHLCRGTQGRIARCPAAAARAGTPAHGSAVADGPGRHPHQTLRPARGRGRHPSQSHARPGRQQVPLRPHLGHAGLDPPAHALGDDRPADPGQALHPRQRHRQAPPLLPLGVSDQAPASGRSARSRVRFGSCSSAGSERMPPFGPCRRP